MKTKLLFSFTVSVFVLTFSFAQNSDVQITVSWPTKAYENKIEVYNTSNDLITTLCDNNQCYTTSQQGVTDAYGSRYNLGCVANGNNYYIKIYDIANDGWASGSKVSVKVAGVEVINNNGSTANTTGKIIYFNVAGGDATCNSLLDTDGDGVIDNLDYDDDGDGIPDGVENLGENRFECTLPELAFQNGAYDASASAGPIGTVGAVYRFSNSIQGYDVLMQITELTGTSIANIDNDAVDNPTFLQTELTLSGTGTPGATFKFTIVNAGTTTPSSEIFRVNGITWDCDGSGNLRESVIYYDAAAYGTENPTSLEVQDLGAGDIQISASGLQEGPGFSTLKVLRAYYQFIGNSFTMRMQAIKTTAGASTRQFGMSFTQCEFLDFNANSLIIVTGEDFDEDGKFNHLDLDSDNDGIPDNVEGQQTLGYIAPSGVVKKETGIDLVYGNGIQVVDTDMDKIPDFIDIDSDNDGLWDIEENGMANEIVVFTDPDNDGLDNLFEGSNLNDPNDVNDEIDNPSASILPDVDGDLLTGGDLDYRDLFDGNPPMYATIDFDGVDDYLAAPGFINGKGEVTIMAWIKIDAQNAGNPKAVIVGEGECSLYIKDGNMPHFQIKTSAGLQTVGPINGINYNEWHHITGVFSNVTGKVLVYVDGEVDSGAIFPIVKGKTLVNSTSWNGNFEIGKASIVNKKDYFKGYIDEVRVFDVALTTDQIQRMVYQEIENNSGKVKGTLIDKDIVDMDTSATIPWPNLLAYYPMTHIVNGTTTDFSSHSRTLRLHNITTIQQQTAPMPFETKADGDWAQTNTWLHGDVWDIEDATKNKNWNIVHIKDQVTSTNSHTNLGLFIDEEKSLKIFGDHKVENSWLLELNGTLDLQGDSQLIQGIHSDLVTSTTGKIIRRQEGTSNKFRYNYWASPIGALGSTNLTNNNAPTNNPNNSPFKVNMLKDGASVNFQFTSAYDQLGKISTYWLYTYINGLTYWDWAFLNPNTPLSPGVGYTQKGTGNAGLEQQYIFEGKPNNGTILVNVTDTGGPGDVAAVSKTEYLLGNPYPSALDIHKFIDDNEGVIDGVLQLWQQWAGDSHNLDEYKGGYAQVNKLGSCRAFQFVGISGAHNGSQDGTIKPSRYLPVAQGFITQIVANGNVEFNNGQRVFIKEADADGTFDTGSTFFKSANSKSKKASDSDKPLEDTMQKLRLEFTAVVGPKTKREVLLGFSNTTSDGYDYGYDAPCDEASNNDFNLNLDGKNMNMQAYGPITKDKVVPLNFKSSGNNTFEIKATEFENIPENQEIYLRDNETGSYFDLKQAMAYRFSSAQGKFNNRFEIVFQSDKALLSTEASQVSGNFIYYQNESKTLFGKKLSTAIDKLAIVNMRGQTVLEYTNVSQATLNNGLKLLNVASGTYVAWLKAQTGEVITKKIIIN